MACKGVMSKCGGMFVVENISTLYDDSHVFVSGVSVVGGKYFTLYDDWQLCVSCVSVVENAFTLYDDWRMCVSEVAYKGVVFK